MSLHLSKYQIVGNPMSHVTAQICISLLTSEKGTPYRTSFIKLCFYISNVNLFYFAGFAQTCSREGSESKYTLW